ncbi:putative Asp/Glu/hydantoin racemase [Seiridium cardinale]|uniref:Asp/Glu/hydantoin racemase n=1 Tax=Seiridium cardinale TaxID=138064 RepID=A0ABR2XQD5_9PEZI
MAYYNTINRVTRLSLGTKHSAPLFLYSANYEEMTQMAKSGDWDAFARVYTDAVEILASKVDAVVICAVMPHKVSGRLQRCLAPLNLPLLHIADCVGRYLQTQHPRIGILGLLGPKITMLGGDDPDFFIGRLQSRDLDIQVLVPETTAELDEVNRGMMDEVTKGMSVVTPLTKDMFVRNALRLVDRGAQAILLGSTDLGFSIKQSDLGKDILVVDPTSVHAVEVVKWALG